MTVALGVREHLNPQQNGLQLAIGPLAGAVDLVIEHSVHHGIYRATQ